MMSTVPTWSSIPDGWTVRPHVGKLPDVLYRYRSLTDASVDWRLEEISQETIFLPAADALNDPDEGRIRWSIAGSHEQAVSYVTKLLLTQSNGANSTDLIVEAWKRADDIMKANGIVPQYLADRMDRILGKVTRIACFTEHPLNGPMWSHYATSLDASGKAVPHGGICIEYWPDEDWRKAGLRPVVYAEERPQINMLLDNRLAQFADAMQIKSPDWGYEKEWRLALYLQAEPASLEDLDSCDELFNSGSKLKMERSVRSVIFGLWAKGDHVSRLVDEMAKACPHVEVKKVTRDPTTAKLKIVKY